MSGYPLPIAGERLGAAEPRRTITGNSAPPDPAASDERTYAEILRSSALIGGASVVTLVIGIVRTKAVAMLLGPAGFGLMGVYMALADLVRAVAGMGISNSGVRQIAEAMGSSDAVRIAATVGVLRRVVATLALLVVVALGVFCVPLSMLTFGTERHAAAIALLALAVALRLVADGEGALVQGTRRIADLARINVAGAFYGTLAAVPIVYFLREDGVVPSLVAVAAAAAITARWYGRRVRIERHAPSLPELRRESVSLLKLGLAFMASALLTMGVAYVVRIFIAGELGLESAGLYQAAWVLGGLYVGFVFQAMGTDFYPRLVAVVQNRARCNQLVNEQAHVSLLLAGPGLIATMSFAPVVVWLFYSGDFEASVEVLRWICMGMALRVVTWPIGFIIVAQNRQVVFFATELAWAVVSVALAWLCIGRFGLAGAGIAFFASYAFHGCMIYPLVRWASGFRYSAVNRRAGVFFVSSIAAVFCGFYALPPLAAAAVGALATLASAFWSARSLLGLVEAERIPPSLRVLVKLLRSRPSHP
jgi:PST family polysaccharide transporter